MDLKGSIKLDESVFNVDFLGGSAADMGKDREFDCEYYKILIVDDEEEVHRMTRMVLKGFDFEGSKMKLLDTYSGAETMKLLEAERDIAVILLDVVMEEDDSGLKVVKYLRDNLKNSVTRIVIRTGQPGKAPEEKVIKEYEINDYKSKTELSVQKLYSTLYVSLRAYKNIRMLQKHKEGLEKVINASRNLFRYNSFTEFLNGLLLQVNSLCDMDAESMLIANEGRELEGIASVKSGETHRVIAATGKFESMIGRSINPEDYPVDLKSIIREIKAKQNEELILLKDNYLIINNHNETNESTNYIVLEGNLNQANVDFVKVFLTNFSLAVDNFLLNLKIRDTQNEIIYRFGEIVENRSNSTGSHVRRVAEITRCLAGQLGYDENDSNSMSLASIMHDVGKMGIADDILLKPGKLLPEEYELMKAHTVIGYNLFKDSKMELLEMAADIALNHHERYDGKGYPSGKKGGEISKVCEIVAVADVFDALVSKRCYKEPWPLQKVVGYFKENRAFQFAPDVVDKLLANLESISEIMYKFPD